ncbi:MAG TPA: cytochrome c biogenesis protein CcdA [Acidimicrobiales bacterium]|nr:cytochrome c biogenesis protein CcdA [Acidimicrobiales bacterium]
MFAASNPNVLVAFGAGMLSFLSPCVLPLVPGYLSLMSGLSAAEMESEKARLLRATLLFVAGFTVVFVALGASASALGQSLQDHQRGLNQGAGIVVIVMGVVLAGALSPAILMRERRFHVSPSSLGIYAPPVMGMAFAFGWTPCIGLVLGPILTLAASEGTVLRGVVLLTAYSLGLGVPFVASGLALGRLTGAFGWVKRHFGVINAIAGGLLVAFGFLLLTNNVSWLSRHVADFLRAVHLDRLSTS